MTGNTILDIIGAEDTEKIVRSSERITLKSGDILSRPNEPVESILFPIDAVISHYEILKDGRTTEVGLTGSEGMVGEGAALSPRDSDYFSEVLISGEAFRIEAGDFRNIASGSEDCKKAVFNYLKEEIDRVSRRVVCNNHHSVGERLALWLLLVRDRCRCEEMPFTQEHVSFFLGVHRPSVTLAMQDLRDQGVLEYKRGKVHLLDPDKLLGAACSCYEELTVKQEPDLSAGRSPA